MTDEEDNEEDDEDRATLDDDSSEGRVAELLSSPHAANIKATVDIKTRDKRFI
jgi:hypothetical protein